MTERINYVVGGDADGRPVDRPCTHLDTIVAVEPNTPGVCEDCIKQGTQWVHLRLCLQCGHVGCCDSSPETHATKHSQASTHPIVRSLERGEEWAWCYPDQLVLVPDVA
jgi:uncharacterized UBP type Zn finger protein